MLIYHLNSWKVDIQIIRVQWLGIVSVNLNFSLSEILIFGFHFVEIFFSSFSTLEFSIYNEKSLIDRLIEKELAITRVKKKTRAEEPAKMR